MRRAFTHWAKWKERNTLDGLHCPGVYVLAKSKRDISATPFSWRKEIMYVGMTNAKGGLKSRLQQFENTIKGGGGHGGAERVRSKYRKYDELTRSLYVSVCPYECEVVSNRPRDLLIMGEVAKREYECLAVFREKFPRLPEFNDKKRSPKKRVPGRTRRRIP
ncbi:MAG: hypothetical protein V2A58_01795 [Planctomycetota bacterium]